jgi:hypothetical protein
MKDIIRKVLREEIQKKYVRSNANMEKVIISYLNKQMVGTKRIVGDPEKFYGNLDEHWCKNGVVIARSVYYFNNDEDDDGPELHNFNEGYIIFSKQIVDDIKRLFSVRESYVLNVITEWYDDNYTTKFGEETGHPEIEVSYCESYDFKGEICPGEVEIPKNMSKDEKIKFIMDNSNEYSDLWLHDAWTNDIDDAYKKVAYKLKTQNNPLSEMIKLDINVGDTVMGGKFKNKKVIVKTIGKNEKGDITINGKPLLRFRILKEGEEPNDRIINELTKIFNSKLIKDIYPIINRIDILRYDKRIMDVDIIIKSDGSDMTESNMYDEYDFDPHWLCDHHLTKFIKMFGLPINKVSFRVFSHEGKFITAY